MDFAKPFIVRESVATKSNIQIVSIPPKNGDEPKNKTDDLDHMLIEAANRAATNLLRPASFSPSLSLLKKQQSGEPNLSQCLVDSKFYPSKIEFNNTYIYKSFFRKIDILQSFSPLF